MKIVKSSRAVLGKKIFNVYVGKNPHFVYFSCTYGRIEGKLTLSGKMFGLQNGLPQDKMNQNFNKKRHMGII